MIATLLRISWLALRRDRAALVLTFVLPVVFFSIFALIFGGMAGGGGMPAVELVLVDEDGSELAARFVAAVRAEGSLVGPDDGEPPLLADRAAARAAVADGDVDAALVIPEGFGDSLGLFADAGAPLIVYADTVANPVAHQVVSGLLQKLAFSAAPDALIGSGIGMFEEQAGPLTERQSAVIDGFLAALSQQATDGAAGDAGEAAGAPALAPVQVEVEDVRRDAADEERHGRVVAYQAAGIGVMFLLFSMSAAAGSLLQEEETGTLERLLTSGLGTGRLLAGNWLFAALVGAVQVVLMFVWGWAVFGLDLWRPDRLAGLAVMIPVTAAAAAAFGLVLGTACRSRAQLSGLSTIVILVMSALGGSMVPRFILQRSAVMDTLGLFTFNAWAIDGFQKVFWYESGLASLAPQVAVLVGLTVVCLALSRWLARRWEVE